MFDLLRLLETAGEIFKVVQSNFAAAKLGGAGQRGTEVSLVGLGARGGGAGPHHGRAGPGPHARVFHFRFRRPRGLAD